MPVQVVTWTGASGKTRGHSGSHILRKNMVLRMSFSDWKYMVSLSNHFQIWTLSTLQKYFILDLSYSHCLPNVRNAWDDKTESTRIDLPWVHTLKVLHSKEVQSSARKFNKRVEASITSNNSKLKLDIHLKNSGNRNKNKGNFVYLNYEDNCLNSPIPLTRVDLAWVHQYPWWLI